MSSPKDMELKKNELKVLKYIEKETFEGKEHLSESMKSIGEKLGISEVTVHRAISKLTQLGYIGYIANTSKFKSNLIVYYGPPVSPEKISEEPFFDMLIEFNQRANRFKYILETYQREYALLKQENESLRQGILLDLHEGSEDSENERYIMFNDEVILESDIITKTAIDDVYVAYIVKKK